MKTIYCRGPECRENIVKTYIVRPTAHSKLLNGQSKQSCTGQVLTDTYYSFECINRVNPKDVRILFCGYRAAEHFLELINHEGLPLFDPLQSDFTSAANQSKSSPQEKGDTINTRITKKWNDEAKQLYEAINLLVMCWNASIYGRLAKYKEDLEKFRDYKPYLERVEYVNSIITKDFKKRTLTQMLDDLRKDNPKLKQFKFDLLDKMLNEKGIVSKF